MLLFWNGPTLFQNFAFCDSLHWGTGKSKVLEQGTPVCCLPIFLMDEMEGTAQSLVKQGGLRCTFAFPFLQLW